MTRIPKPPQTVESNFAWLAFMGNILPSLLLVLALWWYGVPGYLLGIVIFFLAFVTLYTVIKVWQKAQYQFRSLHNLLESLVQGNYSFRGRVSGNNSALADLVNTINSLAQTLQKQKFQSEESLLLLGKVVDQIDVAIIAWDQHDRIQLINPAARTLLGLHDEEKGEAGTALPACLRSFEDMKVGETLVLGLEFPGTRGRFRVHMEAFIAEGSRHRLLFLTDVSNILRKEEKKAWLNLIRVLSHEINNSLAPLSSLSASLKRQVAMRETDPELAAELTEGMSVIGKRAESLAGFVRSYHVISKLPEPRKAPVDLKQMLERLARLFPHEHIRLEGPALLLPLDGAQIEQALINLVKNAIEAGTEAAGSGAGSREAVEIRWLKDKDKAYIRILDRGRGISSTQNLFTPFYTTKAKGSGVGLVLSQQIIEAHEGHISIGNRPDGRGGIVTIELPAEGRELQELEPGRTG